MESSQVQDVAEVQSVAEGVVEGALTQGLRILREHADESPISFSPPASPTGSFLFTQPDEDEGSFLFRTANDHSLENVSTSDIDEIPATPPLPPRRLMSVVTRRRTSPPLRNTPIGERLRSLSSSSSNISRQCAYCSHPDGRKASICCVQCHRFVHSVSCAGFTSHREAKHAKFVCRACSDPSTPLPLVSTPRVASRVVIGHQDQDPPGNNPPPANHNLDSPPPSPIPNSSPLPPQTPPHASPDHTHLASRAAEPPINNLPLPFSLDQLFDSKIVVLRHCPKTARREFASLLNSVWSVVLNNPINIDSWIKAFAVPKLVLFLPPGKKKFKDKAASVKSRIVAFQDGRFEQLWRDATRPVKGRRAAAAPNTANNFRRAKLLAQEGQYGQAAKALLSQGLDFDSQEAIDSMRAKHPSSPPPPILPPPDATPYSFSSAETLAALNTFHSLTAGGPSGCRAAHLREAITSERGNTLLATMTRLINFLAAGKTPPEIDPFLCGGNLFAAVKKDGGHRPIAVGETIRRWTAKCMAKKAIADTAEYLSPLQLGVRVKGGAEAIIHATSAIYNDDNISTEDKWVLQIDFENAFNSISRARMLEEIRKRCPKAAKWAESCYQSSSHLFFGKNRLSSSSGAQQGDPLAILFFALVLQPLLERINDQCPTLLLLAFFLDDGTLIGRREELQQAFDILSIESLALGLRLNPSKSSIWCGDALPSDIDAVDPLDRNVPRAPVAGFQLLGAPVGNIPFSRDLVEERINKIGLIFDILPGLDDAQSEFALLRHCFSLPKLTYCLRTCNPSHLLSSYKEFDRLQFSSFSQLFGRPLDATAKTQAFLPVKSGGTGLRSAQQHCSAAFIASNFHSRPIVDKIIPPNVCRRSLADAFALLQQYSGNATYVSEDFLPPDFNQHSLSREIDSNFASILLDKAEPRDRARLLSLSLPHAGDFLDATPSPALGLHLDSRSFGVAIAYRLGLDLLDPGECRALNCAHNSDAKGDHAMHCHDDNGLKSNRHNQIRDNVYREAQHASLNPTKEMPGLILNSQSRPADIYVANWIDGRKTAFDVSVVSPTQEAILHRAADSAGAAIEMRKASKFRTHFNNCREQGISFQPLVVETFGGWDKDATKFLKEMARQAARRWGMNDAIEIKHFFQRLSVALQRGNSALLINRDADPRDLYR